MRTNMRTCVLGALILCAGGLTGARSNTIVNFSVDMTEQIGGAFIPGTDMIEAHGSFNGWGAGLALTNDPGGLTPNIYSGTADNSTDANGGVMTYKFVINGSNWENPADGGKNRAAKLPSTSGATLTLPTPHFSDSGTPVANDVRFQVNMAQQINLGAFTPGTSTVYARGDFNGFDLSLTLTNDPSIKTTNQFGLVNSNVYVGTATVNASPNAAETFKYYFDPGANWENPSPANGNPDHDGNRFFVNAAQTLPIVDYSDAPYAPIATNAVTFQVDMSAQLLGGAFDPAQDVVDVRGNFNNWTGGVNICTNDPAASNTNIYSTVVVVTDGVGAVQQFKYTYGGPNVPGGLNWENPAPPTVGGNRFFNQPNATATTLPAVFFSDIPLSDLLPADTEVTFNVSMTNALQYPSGTPFNPGSDTVYVNGDFLGWWAWGLGAPPQYQMTNNPVGSGNYSLTILVPKGTPVGMTYKYGIGGFDNEAGFGQNHVRYIRTVGTYSMPLDTFGVTTAEISFGNLAVGKPVSGHVPITWLGRPGVMLQSAPGITGPWQSHSATDGTSSTNWPVSGSSVFFRLIKPGS